MLKSATARRLPPTSSRLAAATRSRRLPVPSAATPLLRPPDGVVAGPGAEVPWVRGTIVLFVLPLFLVTFVLFLVRKSPWALAGSGRKTSPGGYGNGDYSGAEVRRYAVVFDAGSSGSRVHVYCFDQNLELMDIGDEIELFVQRKPGLSAYANDPKEAANSLVSLLDEAELVIPEELRQRMTVRVGATAGLKTLGTEKSEQIAGGQGPPSR